MVVEIGLIGGVNRCDIVEGWRDVNFNSGLGDVGIGVNIKWVVIVLYGDAFV